MLLSMLAQPQHTALVRAHNLLDLSSRVQQVISPHQSRTLLPVIACSRAKLAQLLADVVLHSSSPYVHQLNLNWVLEPARHCLCCGAAVRLHLWQLVQFRVVGIMHCP